MRTHQPDLTDLDEEAFERFVKKLLADVAVQRQRALAARLAPWGDLQDMACAEAASGR